MTRNPKLQDLTAQVQALMPEELLQLLRRVVTPEIELRLLAEELSQRTSNHDPEQVARDVDQAVDDVRRAREARRTEPRTELR